MCRLLRITLCAGVVVALAATMAIADRQVSVEGLVPTPINLDYTASTTDCTMGNLNQGSVAHMGLVTPPADFKLVFDPRTYCSTCPIGFRVTRIWMDFYTTVACSMAVSLDLERAVFQSPGCYVPGPMLCATHLYQLYVPHGGLWEVGIAVHLDDGCPACPNNSCFLMSDGPYCLSGHFQSISCDVDSFGIVTDSYPAELCLNWAKGETGWYDLLVAFPAWQGQLKFYAYATCCEFPSATESGTWGGVKALYR